MKTSTQRMRCSPMQGCELQGRPSSTTPSQRYDSSGGERQVRVRVWIPPPHSLLHCAHWPQALQPPKETHTKSCVTYKVLVLWALDHRVLSHGWNFFFQVARQVGAPKITEVKNSIQVRLGWLVWHEYKFNPKQNNSCFPNIQPHVFNLFWGILVVSF